MNKTWNTFSNTLVAWTANVQRSSKNAYLHVYINVKHKGNITPNDKKIRNNDM